ncbi:CHASE domain-containing protein [Croceicoccus sp. Ery15]|uniref:CHASE domain-containing protein n=1 Tax=Croceicoccus sp. Ery15 TaxID=1703338 RepID=UPI001E5284BB|nr:CHASE domain-containing protein [Croceicoccus sp. Ery15]
MQATGGIAGAQAADRADLLQPNDTRGVPIADGVKQGLGPAGQQAGGPQGSGLTRAERRMGGTLRWFSRFPRALPLAIFITIFAMTLLGVWAIERAESDARRADLEQLAVEAGAALERRANANAAYLRSGAALFASQDSVPVPMFQTFVGQLRLDSNFRGADGIGWAARVNTGDVAAFENRMREVGVADFAVDPLPSADQAYAVPVTNLQPETERNRRALGFNMFSEPVRRDAMIEAEESARPTASGRVVLVQEGDVDAAGFLVYMPVFHTGADGMRELKGYIYSPFNAQDFVDSAMQGMENRAVQMAIYDETVAPDRLMAQRATGEAGGESVRKIVQIANREWVLELHSLRPAALSQLSLIALIAGLICSTLALAIAWLLTRQAVEARQVIELLEEQAAIRNSLTRELNHRVKNTLANVLSIVSLTRRRADSIESFAESLDGRIRALSATHDLLTQSEWGTTPVRSVIEVEMAPYAQGRDAVVEMNGPHVELAPNDALSMGLAIHELATNAAKYGALSTADGKVEVDWDLMSDDLVRVRWRESGGPEVSQDRKRGFGTDLIEKIVAHELRNPVELVFEPTGVRCTMLIPVRSRSEFVLRAKRMKQRIDRAQFCPD